MVTDKPGSPSHYAAMYGVNNPWVRWLAEKMPALLLRPPVEFWFGDQRSQSEKVAARER